MNTQKGAQKQSKSSDPVDMLIELGKEGNYLFTDQNGEPCICLDRENSSKAIKLKSKAFKNFLAKGFYEEHQQAPSPDSFAQALVQLEAIASFSGATHPVEARLRRFKDSIYYDLHDGNGTVVEITATGWRTVKNSPVFFATTSNMKTQCTPAQQGNIRKLLKHVRFKNKGDKLLYLVYIVTCFIPDIPHPVLIFAGEKGAAKSTSTRFTRSVVDPAVRDISSMPGGVHDLAISLKNNYMPAYDNLTSISAKVSDLLCTASTGGGFSTRKFYTDDEETIMSFLRCLILNGINVVATKADLLDRSIILELDRIEESDRRPEREILEAFEQDKPEILSGLFSVLNEAMAIYPTVELSSFPRMADFAQWGYAVAEAIKQGLGKTFLRAYNNNISKASEEAVSAHPVASAIIALMKKIPTWTGSVSDLLDELESIASREKIETRTKEWPKAPHVLSRRIREVKSNLKACGIDVEIRHKGDYKEAIIQKAIRKQAKE
ncbi:MULTISPECIES: hypothetical protein [unclassified Paenibacillus]|uniref:hypothetical protein n=1 Tax=unclassified Paenibacillus TaxID=185978 RepID=UPI0024752399|nr:MULTISPECIES: hypothetical protein [unclassified Paenibacillus]MDH6429055.1 hypothetical protein [Paenibacillus sp. PastH-4]MDH6445260.1 hypothetical protein [Paenibacillus sp. PastF-4]MDH6529150.1 hypothetical protein [Paenibacillus sp. PastH-3]